MAANTQYRERDDSTAEDPIVCLNDISWDDDERLLDMRGDHSAPRIRYLERGVEITSPCQTHQAIT